MGYDRVESNGKEFRKFWFSQERRRRGYVWGRVYEPALAQTNKGESEGRDGGGTDCKERWEEKISILEEKVECVQCAVQVIEGTMGNLRDLGVVCLG